MPCAFCPFVWKKNSFYYLFITEFSYAGTSKTIINPRKLAVTNLYNSTVCGLYRYLYLFEGGKMLKIMWLLNILMTSTPKAEESLWESFLLVMLSWIMKSYQIEILEVFKFDKFKCSNQRTVLYFSTRWFAGKLFKIGTFKLKFVNSVIDKVCSFYDVLVSVYCTTKSYDYVTIWIDIDVCSSRYTNRNLTQFSI